MSVQATKWALDDVLHVKPCAKLVLLALANYAGHDGACWPSQATIARQCCMGERTVRRNLKELEDGGYITRETRFDPVNMRRKTDVITLQFSKSDNNQDPTDPSDDEGGEPGDSGEENPTGQNGRSVGATGQKRPIPPAKMAAKPKDDPSLDLTTEATPEKGPKKKHSIPDDWQPSAKTITTLEKKNIDREFILGLVDEFVIYWSERGDKRPGWDATFINFVKHEKERADQKKASAPRMTVGGQTDGKGIRNDQKGNTPAERAEFNAIKHLQSVGVFPGGVPAYPGAGDHAERALDSNVTDISVSMGTQDGDSGREAVLLLDESAQRFYQ